MSNKAAATIHKMYPMASNSIRKEVADIIEFNGLHQPFDIDEIVSEYTGFTSMDDLIYGAFPTYTPSVNVTNKYDGTKFKIIANFYDAYMILTGDERRAYRF